MKVTLADYRRAVLLLWPISRNDEVLQGEEFVTATIRKLEDDCVSRTEQMRLAEYLLQLVEAGDQKACHVAEILKAASRLACRLKDASLWCRAMSACDGHREVSSLGVDGIKLALRHVGKDVVLPKFVLSKLPPEAI